MNSKGLPPKCSVTITTFYIDIVICTAGLCLKGPSPLPRTLVRKKCKVYSDCLSGETRRRRGLFRPEFGAIVETETHTFTRPQQQSHLLVCSGRSSTSAMYERAGDVAIFWDYENCPAPAGSSGWEIVKEIRRAAQVYGSIKVFKAYLELPEHSCSPESRSLQLRSELQASGVSLTDCPHNGRKDVADKMILVDMMAHAIDNPAPLTYVLISGDRDFAYALAVLRLRCYQIVLATRPASHNSLRSQATTCLNWDDILRRTIQRSRNTQSQEPHLISDMPRHETPSERVLPLRGPLRENMTPPHEQDESSTGSADLRIVDYLKTRRQQRHSSVSSSISENLTSSHDATTHADTAYFSARGSSRAASPFSDSERTNAECDIVSMHWPSSYSTNRRASISDTTSYEPSRPQISGYSFGDITPNSVPVHGIEKLSERAPVFLPLSRGTNSLPSLVAPTTTSVANSTVTLTPPPPPVPPIFQPLIKLLKKYQAKGNWRPLRSILTLDLNKQAQIYKKANVDKFGQYIALAERSKIVTLGGREGDAWISLRPEWCK